MPKPLTTRQIMGIELARILDEVFHKAHVRQISWGELAEKSGLHLRTIFRLGEFETMYPRFQTVSSLARCRGHAV